MHLQNVLNRALRPALSRLVFRSIPQIFRFVVVSILMVNLVAVAQGPVTMPLGSRQAAQVAGEDTALQTAKGLVTSPYMLVSRQVQHSGEGGARGKHHESDTNDCAFHTYHQQL